MFLVLLLVTKPALLELWTDLHGDPTLSIPVSEHVLNFRNTFDKFPTFPPYVAHRLKAILKKTTKAQKDGRALHC
jgi:hypothetical protein